MEPEAAQTRGRPESARPSLCRRLPPFQTPPAPPGMAHLSLPLPSPTGPATIRPGGRPPVRPRHPPAVRPGDLASHAWRLPGRRHRPPVREPAPALLPSRAGVRRRPRPVAARPVWRGGGLPEPAGAVRQLPAGVPDHRGGGGGSSGGDAATTTTTPPTWRPPSWRHHTHRARPVRLCGRRRGGGGGGVLTAAAARPHSTALRSGGGGGGGGGGPLAGDPLPLCRGRGHHYACRHRALPVGFLLLLHRRRRRRRPGRPGRGPLLG